MKAGFGMDEEYIKRLRAIKPSEFAEEVFGIKLLWYQKLYMDTFIKTPAGLCLCPRGRVDLRMLEAVRRASYERKKVFGLRIKIFTCRYCSELECQLNKWLENQPDIKVTDIKFSLGVNLCAAMVLYETLV